jgi:hypothetical protein
VDEEQEDDDSNDDDDNGGEEREDDEEPLAPPPSDPVSPPLSVRRLNGPVVDRINARFRDAKPSSELDQLGVLLHAFDGYEESGRPWRACTARSDCNSAGSSNGGRESAFLVFGGLREQLEDIPAFGDAGGVVLSPAHTLVLCGYPGDGGTQHANCEPPIGSEDCVPGCVHEAGYCDPEEPVLLGWCLCGRGYCYGRPQPWRLGDFAAMVQAYANDPDGYNEIIVSAEHWNDHLPRTIEAFFFHCWGGGEAAARDAHRAFQEEFGVSAEEVPLLCLDASDWEYPFELR